MKNKTNYYPKFIPWENTPYKPNMKNKTNKCNCGEKTLKGYNKCKTCCLFLGLMGRGNQIKKVKEEYKMPFDFDVLYELKKLTIIKK